MVTKEELEIAVNGLIQGADENIRTLNSIGKGNMARDWAIIRTKLQEVQAWSCTFCKDVREVAGADE
jgi:hypothetical protein